MWFLDIYWTSLLILVPCVTLVLGRNIVLRTFGRFSTNTVVAATKKGGCEEEGEDVERRDTEAAGKFRWLFLRVYLLVMGSEWLQGPYMYTFLKDEKNYPDRTVALLYMAAYISAAISAPLTGYLADRIGRRTACLAYCAIHSLASLSVLSSALSVILAGRILAGVGTTLLWSVFESWMVADAMYGVMTTYNCITAILAGLVAHCVVLALGSKTHLFILALILDSTAAIMILRTWTENRGGAGNSKQLQQPHDENTDAVDSLGDRLLDSLKNVRVWVLSLVSCCFEGTIFLFMYYWPGALQGAHDHHSNTDSGATPGHQLPFGVIFASFMAIMVLGALLFDILMTRQQHGKKESGDTTTTTTLHQQYLPIGLLAVALLLGGLGFLGAAFFAHQEASLLCVFLLLEAGNGLYVPSMGYQRSQVVSDARRASVYGFMNMPLFVFVALALVTTNGAQVDDHRHIVFVLCAVLLFAAGLGAFVGLRVRSSPEKEYEEIKGTDVNDMCIAHFPRRLSNIAPI
ncbi:major facilitator superfamily domain-containing protein 5 [Apiospora hydei]|uniref:Molybdate-anion transporter n=1 Tax=Apiospora hydei TaxID=1337664 RepID=A0ABR1UXC6_9PEZI